jgi:hypothetical protein
MKPPIAAPQRGNDLWRKNTRAADYLIYSNRRDFIAQFDAGCFTITSNLQHVGFASVTIRKPRFHELVKTCQTVLAGGRARHASLGFQFMKNK